MSSFSGIDRSFRAMRVSEQPAAAAAKRLPSATSSSSSPPSVRPQLYQYQSQVAQTRSPPSRALHSNSPQLELRNGSSSPTSTSMLPPVTPNGRVAPSTPSRSSEVPSRISSLSSTSSTVPRSPVTVGIASRSVPGRTSLLSAANAPASSAFSPVPVSPTGISSPSYSSPASTALSTSPGGSSASGRLSPTNGSSVRPGLRPSSVFSRPTASSMSVSSTSGGLSSPTRVSDSSSSNSNSSPTSSPLRTRSLSSSGAYSSSTVATGSIRTPPRAVGTTAGHSYASPSAARSSVSPVSPASPASGASGRSSPKSGSPHDSSRSASPAVGPKPFPEYATRFFSRDFNCTIILALRPIPRNM